MELGSDFTRSEEEKEGGGYRSAGKTNQWFDAQICVRFVRDRLSETGGVADRNLSRAKSRDLGLRSE